MKKWILGWLSLVLGVISYADKPVVFWASDPVGPNETIMVQGDQLDGETVMQVAPLVNGAAGTEHREVDFATLKYVDLESVQPSAQTGKYIVPEKFEQAIYAIRPVRGDEVGKTLLVNAPDPWWLQGDLVKTSTTGSLFCVYGKCLSYEDRAQVLLKAADGALLPLKIAEQDMWHLEAELGETPVGEYDVMIHNGLGARQGWIKAGMLKVKEKKAWPEKIFNVVDYGAKPNFNPSRDRLDETNDSPAFQAALDAAGANGGGVVFVPKGCYRLVDALNVPRFVTIRGESMYATNLGWTDKEEPPLGLINGSNSFAVEDLTIFVQNYWSVIRGDHGHIKDSGNISVKRVTIRANRYLGIMNRAYPKKWKEIQIERRWNIARREAAINIGGENIEVRDCDVNASHNSIILDKASGFVVNNKLHCPLTFQASQYWVRGCNNLVMSHNDIYGGGCMGTHNTSRGQYKKKDWECYFNPFSRNVYFAHNHQYDNWKWDREMMTLDSHGYDGPYVGPVVEAKGNTVKLPGHFPVLRVGGEICRVSGGAILSQKKLKEGEWYKLVVKMESKKHPVDWDRCYVSYYDGDEPLPAVEPRAERNGDSRHYGHGKVNGARIRGKKGFEVKSFRIAKSWEELVSGGETVFENVTLDGKNSPKKDLDVVFDFDADGVLYAEAIVKAKGPYTTGQVELMMEDGKRALDTGISRLGGTKVDFNRIPKSPNQHSGNINLYKGAFVYVLEGKGCGQYRKILDGKGDTLILDRPWDVELDDTTVISVHRTHDHQLFVNNRFEDGGEAMLLYSGCVENIVAGNTSTRAGGYTVTGLRAAPPMYCQFIDNHVVTGAGLGGPPFNLRGGRIAVEPYNPIGYLNGYQAVGIVMRGNRFENVASATVAGPVQNVLIENNKFSNTDTAVIVDSVGMGSYKVGWYWPQDVLIRDNIFENVVHPVEVGDEKLAAVKVMQNGDV